MYSKPWVVLYISFRGIFGIKIKIRVTGIPINIEKKMASFIFFLV